MSANEWTESVLRRDTVDGREVALVRRSYSPASQARRLATRGRMADLPSLYYTAVYTDDRSTLVDGKRIDDDGSVLAWRRATRMFEEGMAARRVQA